VSAATLRTAQPATGHRPSSAEPGWLGWLGERLDPSWRAGEWDQESLLFTGNLANDQTAVWPCRTPGCSTATRRQYGRCEGCRRARSIRAVSWDDFDAAPPQRPTRPLMPTSTCLVAGCASEPLCRGLCQRHEKSWRRHPTEPVEEFVARARPLPRQADCLVAGCVREGLTRRGLCRLGAAPLK